jgi:PBSX family phage terminase large subunit
MAKSEVYVPAFSQVVDFIPHEGQKRIFTTKSRFIFAMGGNRGGKTTAGCYWSYLSMQTPGTTTLIAANTIDQLNQSVLQKFFSIFPQLERYYIKRDKMMKLPNGSTVLFRSLEIPNLLKGMNCHAIWVDEADGIKKSTWTIIRSRVASTGGKILCTSSIYPVSWIYNTILKMNDPTYELLTWESRQNPSFSQNEWEALKRETDPIDFAREYESKFAFATGKVYGEIDDYGFIDKVPDDVQPVLYLWGLDYGVTDPTAITVTMLGDNGCFYLVDEYYQSGLGIQDINFWLEAFIQKYGRPYLTAQDPAGGVARNSLTPACLPRDAVKKIPGRITLIRSLIYQHRVFCLNKCVNTKREFQTYSFEQHQPNVPEDRNNHSMDSFGMAMHSAWPEIMHRAKLPDEKKRDELAKVEEELSPFWLAKKEQGIYKGGGMLEDRINDESFLDDF